MKTIKWNSFFSMVNDLDDQLNSRKDRFDKADILELGVQMYSDGDLTWCDEVGYDHMCERTGDKIEMKSQKYCLLTKIGNPKKKTASIKLTNTLGSSSDRKYKKTFDKLLIVDTGNESSYSAAYVSYEDMKPYVKSSGDGFTIQIPVEKLNWLVTPKELEFDTNKKSSENYREKKREIQEAFLRAHR